MSGRVKSLVVLGLSLSSSWGNGHATTYRALLGELAMHGTDITFLERDQPWYAEHRDLRHPEFCRLVLYDSVAGLDRHRHEIARADAVIVGSYVPDGIEVGRRVRRWARGVTAFYDIDTPVTLAAVDAGRCGYLTRAAIGGYDLYLSFTGGPTLARLEREYGARRARALYCSFDPASYAPLVTPRRWDLGYLGTYSADRQCALERLLLEPARRRSDLRFVIAGSQFPETISWPSNVERIEHLAPSQHRAFYGSLGWSLNLTRQAMIEVGFSPSVRIFESAGCGAPIISDRWPGLESVLAPDSEIVVADGADDVLSALAMGEEGRARIATAAMRRVNREHSGGARARQLVAHLEQAMTAKAVGGCASGASRRVPQELT